MQPTVRQKQLLMDIGNIDIDIAKLNGEKERLENKKLSSEALETMQKAYDKFTEDALKNYQKITLELDDLRKRLFEVTEQLNLEMIKYDKLKQSYDKLKLEFDTYKEKHNNKK